MAGLKGFQREPAAETRARRNSASLASFTQFIGSTEVIQLSGLGELTLRLKSDGGLVNTTGELAIKLDGSTLALSASGLAADPAAIDHDALLNFAANEHVDHSTVNVNTTAPLTGGGDLTATRTLALSLGSGVQESGGSLTTDDAAIDHDALLNFVGNEHVDHSAVNVDTTAPLTGGGDLTATRTLALSVGPGLEVNASNELQVENADGASKGDILVYDGSAWQRLAVGTDGQRLEADSTTATGLKWVTP